MDIRNYETYYTTSLRESGYFITLYTYPEDCMRVIVDCSIYITDIDSETNTINILEIRGDRDTETCEACGSTGMTSTRILTNNTLPCPLCGNNMKPWSLIERKYLAVFKIGRVPGTPATLEASLSGTDLWPMPSKMAESIGQSLRSFYMVSEAK